MKKTGLDIEDIVVDLSTDVAVLLNVPGIEDLLGPVLVYALEQLDVLLLDYLELGADD